MLELGFVLAEPSSVTLLSMNVVLSAPAFARGTGSTTATLPDNVFDVLPAESFRKTLKV